MRISSKSSVAASFITYLFFRKHSFGAAKALELSNIKHTHLQVNLLYQLTWCCFSKVYYLSGDAQVHRNVPQLRIHRFLHSHANQIYVNFHSMQSTKAVDTLNSCILRLNEDSGSFPGGYIRSSLLKSLNTACIIIILFTRALDIASNTSLRKLHSDLKLSRHTRSFPIATLVMKEANSIGGKSCVRVRIYGQDTNIVHGYTFARFSVQNRSGGSKRIALKCWK